MDSKIKGEVYPVNVVVFEGVYHGFDLQTFGEPKYRKQTINLDEFNARVGTMGSIYLPAERVVSSI